MNVLQISWLCRCKFWQVQLFKVLKHVEILHLIMDEILFVSTYIHVSEEAVINENSYSTRDVISL